jgi:tRNA(Arg) A34 adenosine deaminase TadA
MDGNKLDKILDEIFDFGQEIMSKYGIYPYVAFVTKNGVIVSKGYNRERETRDVTQQGDVVAIRTAQESLETGSLSGYTLVSLFEPTILGFDVALWSGITDFIWCINSSSLPNHYHKINYNPIIYAQNHPGKIIIKNGLREKEGLQLVKISKEKQLYPDNLL